DTSAMAVTATRCEPASPRRWVRPIRPAPMSPSRNGAAMSQPPRREKGPVEPLVLGRLREPLRAARQDVLLHHQPTAEGNAAQAVKWLGSRLAPIDGPRPATRLNVSTLNAQVPGCSSRQTLRSGASAAAKAA